MYRKFSLLLICGTLALGLFVPNASCEEVSGSNLITPGPIVKGVPQIDSCLPGEESITLEEFDQLGRARKVCNVRCDLWPYINCNQACGEAATCYDGYCLYL